HTDSERLPKGEVNHAVHERKTKKIDTNSGPYKDEGNADLSKELRLGGHAKAVVDHPHSYNKEGAKDNGDDAGKLAGRERQSAHSEEGHQKSEDRRQRNRQPTPQWHRSFVHLAGVWLI